MKRSFSTFIICTIITAFGIVIISDNINARKIKYTSKEIKTPIKNRLDSIEYSIDMLNITGYDKTASANKESFFITNNTLYTIESIDVNIVYSQEDGRMLHNRDERIELGLKPGETKIVYLKSWDNQYNFRYYLSPETSKKKISTPYHVKITPRYIYISRQLSMFPIR